MLIRHNVTVLLLVRCSAALDTRVPGVVFFFFYTAGDQFDTLKVTLTSHFFLLLILVCLSVNSKQDRNITIFFCPLCYFGSRVAKGLFLCFLSQKHKTKLCYFDCWKIHLFYQSYSREQKVHKTNTHTQKKHDVGSACLWCLITWGCCPNNIYLNLQIHLSLQHSYVRWSLLCASVHFGEGAG